MKITTLISTVIKPTFMNSNNSSSMTTFTIFREPKLASTDMDKNIIMNKHPNSNSNSKSKYRSTANIVNPRIKAYNFSRESQCSKWTTAVTQWRVLAPIRRQHSKPT